MRICKLGIIGGGRIAQVHSEGISTLPQGKVLSLADPYLNDEIRGWGSRFGIRHFTKDYREVLQNPEVDAVLICSPTDTHAAIIEEAAWAKKHIFCEKPVDQDIHRIKKVLGVVTEEGVKFQIGFNRRFDHNFRAVRTAIQEGKIGDLHIIKITSRDPEAPSLGYIKKSGGLFMDMTIHDFDMLRYLAGSEVESIFVQGGVMVDSAIGKAGDIDTALITVRFQNGIIGSIDNSRKASYGYDQRVEAFGSKGSIATENDRASTTVLSTEGGVMRENPLYFFLERYRDSFRQEIREFISAVQEDKDPPTGPLDALRPVQIALAARESLQSSSPVKVNYDT